MNSVYARIPRTTAYGLETVSFLQQNLWRDLPLHIKKSQSVKRFKKHIKVWNFMRNCRVCKSFVVNLDYIYTYFCSPFFVRCYFDRFLFSFVRFYLEFFSFVVNFLFFF